MCSAARGITRSVLALMVVAAGFFADDAHARKPEARTADYQEQLRVLVDQQQQIIESQQRQHEAQQREIDELKRQVEALRSLTRGQARDEASGEAELAPASEGPAFALGGEESLDEWTREDLGEEPPPPTGEKADERPGLTTSPRRFEVSVGGHLNRAVNVASDGRNTTGFFVDNGNAPTLVYLKGSARVTEDLTLGGQIEFGLQDNSALVVSQDNDPAGLLVSGRKLELIADSESFGKLSFGKGFAASFFLAEIDKSGTYAGNLLSVGNTAGGLQFVDRDTDALSGIPITSVFLDLEGINLINRVRYDSPVWNGFQLSGSLGERDFGDLAFRWNGETEDLDISVVSSGKRNPQGGFSSWRVDGGLGVLHKPTGLNLTAGASGQDVQGSSSDAYGFIVRAGLRRNWFDFGETKTAIDFTRAWDITQSGERTTSAGGFIFQEIAKWNMELYAGYRWYDLERRGLRLDDIGAWTFGGRFWFDLTASGPLPQLQ